MNPTAQKFIYSCKKATELTEKKMAFGLSWSEDLRLKMHLRICSTCRDYQQKSIFLENIFKKINTQNADFKQLSDDAKQKIILYLEKN